MPLFPNIDSLEAYVDAYIKANGNQEITGPINNDALNGCIEFIRQSPLNWAKAAVISAGGVQTATVPVSIYMTSTPTSLTWGDNIYNEFIFVNMTANTIPLASGKVYYNAYGTPISSIPPNQSINIVKASNDLWVQSGASLPFPLNNSVPDPLEFIVSSSTFIATGASTVVIPQFIGYNLDFYRNKIPQSQVQYFGDIYFSWNRSTATLNLLPVSGGEASDGELMQLLPTTGRGFVLQPGDAPFYPFIITSADFEADGVTYNNPDIVGINVSLQVNNFTGNFLSPGNGLTMTSTGLIVDAPGFDANAFDYTIKVEKIN